MNPSITRTSFVLATFVSALLAACGGGGGGGGGGTPATAGGTSPGNPYGGNPGTSTGTTGTYGGAGGGGYLATGLVSDSTSAIAALHQDPNLVNAWGLAFNPTGYSWVANAGTSTSTLYDGNGVAQSLVVTIPAGAVGAGNPSGIVYNATTDFSITANAISGAPPFIFATLEGQIAAWAPNVDGTHAFTEVDLGTAGASFTGLAIGASGTANRLFAADFAQGSVDVFSATYAAVTTTGGFVDPTLPAGYAPFGIQQIGGKIYVAYAQVDATTGRDQPGAGLGLVDVFDTDGNLLTHLVAAGGALNAPWGLALAPSNFGTLSGKLLVGNFGDGKINAYDPTTGAFAGTLDDDSGAPIVIAGLWALQFGNGINAQPTNTLFYTSGPDGETHGLYGRIDLN